MANDAHPTLSDPAVHGGPGGVRSHVFPLVRLAPVLDQMHAGAEPRGHERGRVDGAGAGKEKIGTVLALTEVVAACCLMVVCERGREGGRERGEGGGGGGGGRGCSHQGGTCSRPGEGNRVRISAV